MSRVALFLSVLLLIGVSPEQSTALPSQSVTRTVLDNGLTIIVAEQHSAEIVTINAWVKVGSRDETDELNGAAHFTEHMLFKGTRRRKVGQLDREVEGLGGILNASTSFDFTQYYITAASRFFDRILDIQADALMNSTFDPEEMVRERKVVLEEIGHRDDTPASLASKVLYTTAYRVHPYRRPIGGTREVLERITRDQLFAFYRAHYGPQNVIIVAVGDVNAQEATTKIRRAYGAWRHPVAPRPVVQPEPAPADVRRAELEHDVRVSYLQLGWIGPGARDREVYAMDVLLFVLGQGRSSRLTQRLRERQRLVQDIGASFPTGLEPLLFQVNAVVEPQDLARAEQAILAEVTEIRESGIATDELERAKMLLLASEAIGMHTSRGLASLLGYSASVADLNFALTYEEQIRRVSREDIQQAARRYLDPRRYAVTVIRPRSR
jgi:zinc protease